jgi:hypothetical protein
MRDQTWSGSNWAPTPDAAHAPGVAAAPDALLHECAESRFAPKVWAGVMGALALLCFVGLFLGEGWGLVQTGFGTVVFGALAALAWHTGRSAATRSVRWDDAGIADQDTFRIRRLPWSVIARFERINSAARRQRDYDAAFRNPNLPQPKGLRPKSIWVWTAFADDGQTLLELIEPMEPPGAFEALRERIAHAVDQRA